ncbi:MAG: hypothetical protein H7210_13165 [Pyrinomonadaceae bacterium]|nr:hypothetical protein [Phycisphaerales bacterium]
MRKAAKRLRLPRETLRRRVRIAKKDIEGRTVRDVDLFALIKLIHPTPKRCAMPEMN